VTPYEGPRREDDREMRRAALIVGRPGPLQDGLRALVGTMPQIGVVNAAHDIPSALSMDLNPGPALVLLDGDDAEGQVWLTVRRTKARWPQSRVMVLVSNAQRQEEAEAAGADAVLLQGFRPARLVAAIVKLLPEPDL